jgi:hypothetical protein
VSFSKPSLSSQVHAFNILCLCSHFFLPLLLFGFFFSISIFFLLSLFVFALWLVFFGLCFSCGFCWPSRHQSANCHSCDRNVWHRPTLTIGADSVSGDIIVVGQYQCWTGTMRETWYIDCYWSWYQRTDQTGMTWTNTKFIQGVYLSHTCQKLVLDLNTRIRLVWKLKKKIQYEYQLLWKFKRFKTSTIWYVQKLIPAQHWSKPYMLVLKLSEYVWLSPLFKLLLSLGFGFVFVLCVLEGCISSIYC